MPPIHRAGEPPPHTGTEPLPRRRPGQTDPAVFTRAAIGPSASQLGPPGAAGRLDQAQHRTSGSPYLAAIAERIIRLRSVRGLTQTELARSAGVSRKTISRLERSRTMPTLDRLHQIAGALRVSLAELAVEPGDSKWDDQSSPPGDAESKERM